MIPQLAPKEDPTRRNSTLDPNHILHGLKYEESDYNALKMPCDWDMARMHALARRTAPDTKDDDMHKKRMA